MPELQDLERLKSEIIRLSDEPALLEKRGLGVPDVSAPVQEEDEELSRLLGDVEEAPEDFGEAESLEEPEDLGAAEELEGFEEVEGLEGTEDLEEAESFEGLEGTEDLDTLDEFGEIESLEEDLSSLEEGEEQAETGESEPEGEEFGDFEETLEGLTEPSETAEFDKTGELEASEDFGEPEDIFGEGEDLGAGHEEPATVEETEGLLESFEGLDELEEPEDFEEPESAGEFEELGEFEESLEEGEFEEPVEEAEELGGLEEEELGGLEEEELGGLEEEDLFGESDLPDFTGEEGPEEEAGEEEPLPEFDEEEELELPEFGEGEELEEGAGEEFEMPGEELEDFGEIGGAGEPGELGEAGEIPEQELEAPAEGTGGAGEGGLEELELPEDEFGGGEFEIDEFNLGDLGEEFGVLEEAGEEEEEVLQSGEGEEELEEEETALDLTDEQFKALGETLLTLPRNLKLIVEEQIGEKGLSGQQLINLVNSLVERKSPKEIAQVSSKIIGRKIKIPSQYEKKTGAAFEAEKDSFAYRFRHRILPLLRTIVLSMIAVGLLIFTGYRYAYRPLYALHLYNQGFEQLEEREYPTAHTYFERALDQWVMKKQFFRYAGEYEQQKQYRLAEEKYDQLLHFFPYDREGTLAYGRLELEKLSNYEKASAILQDFLRQEPKEYDVMLLLGDTYLEWGREDPAKYEQARYNYAVLMENYGVKDDLLFRMMRYFVRTDNFEEVMNLNRYYQERPDIEVDPEAYAEMAGYFLDKDRLDDIRDILFRAREADEELPEIHYQLARYFLRIKEYHEEEKALRNTLSFMQNISPLTSDRIEMKVDTYRRYGERLYSMRKYLEARTSYTQGIELYEQSKARKLIEAKPELGKIYADLADIYYYQGGEFAEASALYDKAERNLYDSNEMKYKQGYISYLDEDYLTAMMRFQRAAGAFTKNPNIIYSTANTLFHRGDYHTAQGYFKHLVEIYERDIERERPLLIDERRDHQALVENIMKASNNLGVTYYNLHRKTGLTDYYSRAMVEFADSSRYFDRLTRNPATLERTGLSNLAFLNQRKLLFPEGDEYDLQIYNSLPLDTSVLELGP